MSKMRLDIRPVTLENIDVTGGFWYEKQKLIKNVSMGNVYKRFAETGRFDAFNFTWQKGEPNRPHIFWDSDVAKWIEAVAYICEKERNPELEKIVDETVAAIRKNKFEDGYFNSYFGHLEPNERFTRRGAHELYCLGHLIEAAIAYKRSTGKDELYNLMKDYTDLVYKLFCVERSTAFLTPGHEEIELALVKLYRESGEKKYLELALHFINERGGEEETVKIGHRSSYAQDHLPVRQQRTAEGHSVRACYLYCAMADLAKETGDEALFEACEELFKNITRRRMYVTGAIGQTSVGEAFMGDFDLPNQTAYTETCANLSLALFARRMSLIDPKSVYADIAELVLYNSFISGVSLDGKSFFYTNMQENDSVVRGRKFDEKHTVFRPADTRVEVFDCSCCPPNVVRIVSSVQDFQYSESGDTVFMHQYIGTNAKIGEKEISVKTEYPYDGNVDIKYSGKAGTLALRIPAWCKSYTLTVCGRSADAELRDGYAYVSVNDGDEIKLSFDMPIRFVEAHPRVWDDAGRIAVTRGPLVYCLEAKDNEVPLREIRLDRSAEYKSVIDGELGIPVLDTVGFVRKWNDEELYSDEARELVPVPVRLIPYFAFANRGATDMLIWTLKK